MLCGSRLLEVLLQGDPVDILVLAHKNRNSGSNYWSGSRSGSGRSLDLGAVRALWLFHQQAKGPKFEAPYFYSIMFRSSHHFAAESKKLRLYSNEPPH